MQMHHKFLNFSTNISYNCCFKNDLNRKKI